MNALSLSSPSKISRKIKSFFCALLLSFILFAVFPLTQVNLNLEKKSPQKYLAIDLKMKADASDANTAQAIGGGLPASVKSAYYASEISVLAPSDYGALGESKIAVEGEFGLRNFSSESISSDTFEVQIFSLRQLDKIPARKSGAEIQYPRVMFNRGIEGKVILSLFINEDGSVEPEKVIFATNEIFAEAALNAVKNLIYEAPTMNNKPVRARFTLEIPFSIEK